MLSHFIHVWLCNPMEYSLPGSSVHGILQARILEWAAMPSSRTSSSPRDWTHTSFIAGRFFTYQAAWKAPYIEIFTAKILNSNKRMFRTSLKLHYKGNCSVQFSSVAQLCLTLWDCMDCSMPGLPIHCQLPEFTQTLVRWVGDAIQPSHPLSSPSPTFNLYQPQGLSKWVSSSHQVAKVLDFQLQHQSFQWIFSIDFL